MWIQWLWTKKNYQTVNDPKMTFNPTCVVIKESGYSGQRSLTPSLDDLWPQLSLLRLHVWLYPRVIVSKSHENIFKYVDTITLFFCRTWSKGHWPLDDLWPYDCWDHNVWLDPRIIVSKSYGDTSMYMDRVINFQQHTTSHEHTEWLIT